MRTILNKRVISMLKVYKLCKSYMTGGTEYKVLNGVSIEVPKGEFVGVMGPSGSGKTTLLHCISCYIKPDSGNVMLGNDDIAALDEKQISRVRREKLGFVFQDFLLLDGLTVKENIMLPRIIDGRTDDSMEKSAESLGEIFGISHIMKKYPAEISGGEKQRTAVARALINSPSLILADEPTGNLDSKSSLAVIESFLRAKKELGATILMVTHDSFAASFCGKAVILQDGMVRKELVRSGSDRKAFQDELLNAVRKMSEVQA